MTNPADNNPITELFLKASAIKDADERVAWLDANCPPRLRPEVDALLESPELETEKMKEIFGGAVDPIVGQQTTRPAPPPLEAFEQIDEFRIVRCVGRGGMASVYLAEDTDLKRRVALKILSSAFTISEVAIARFRQEAVTVAQLQHKGIVPIYRVGEARGMHFLAIEFVDGPTLAERLDALQRSTPDRGRNTIRGREYIREQVELLAQVADALDHAHRHDVIHRDVKPNNIMLDADGHARLTDFGIARNLRLESVTMTGQMAGTVAYMSPEQAKASARGVDHRTDVFSLGVTLYECLTLTRPFAGESLEDIRKNIIEKAPAPLATLNSGLPRDLVTICHKAMEKDPVHRYQTAAHVAADLRCFLDGRPILARPPSLYRRARTVARDHRTLATTAAASLALVGASIPIGAMVVRADRLSQRTLVSVEPDRDARIYRQFIDPKTGTLGDAELIGAQPKRTQRGVHLFTFKAADGGFAEAIRYVPAPEERSENPRTGLDESDLPLIARITVPPPGFTPDTDEMVLIEAGTFAPAHGTPRSMRAFYIDRYEVTNGEYLAWLQATGAPAEAYPYHWSGDDGLTYDDALADHPIVGVSAADAAAYAHWRGKRLPTSDEWEYAMTRNTDGRVPWTGSPELPPVSGPVADGWKTELAAYTQFCLPARSRPDLATPLGIHHALTNVTELVADMDLASGTLAVVRGGSWKGPIPQLSRRSNWPWRSSATYVGFRCVRPAQPAF